MRSRVFLQKENTMLLPERPVLLKVSTNAEIFVENPSGVVLPSTDRGGVKYASDGIEISNVEGPDSEAKLSAHNEHISESLLRFLEPGFFKSFSSQSWQMMCEQALRMPVMLPSSSCKESTGLPQDAQAARPIWFRRLKVSLCSENRSGDESGDTI